MRIVLALAALCAGCSIATLPSSSGLGAAAIGGLLGLTLAVPALVAVPAPRGRVERFSPLALAAFFVPVFTMAVAPGADMAMHVALARGLLEGTLSPAWPGVHPALYPRGFSALVAVLAHAGLARAGLLAAGLSYVVFWGGLASVLDRFGAPGPRTVAVLCVFCSPLPQQYFGWGGNPTALALGLGFLAAGFLERRVLAAVLLAGATSVHPLGAMAGALVVLVVAAVERRFVAGAAALLAFAAVAGLLQLLGPSLSASEARWIAEYARHNEALPWWALAVGVAVGSGIALAAHFRFAVRATGAAPRDVSRIQIQPAAALLGAAAPRDASRIQVRAAALALAATALLLLLAPFAGLYAVRLAPIALVPLGLLAARLPRPALLAAAAAGLFVHLRTFQRAEPIATFDDLRAIACVAAHTPRTAVIEGAYGDATQWIPALAGRAVTNPHLHVSLFDEAARPQPAPAFRFTGERLRYGAPLPAAQGTEVCRAGSASLVALPER